MKTKISIIILLLMSINLSAQKCRVLNPVKVDREPTMAFPDGLEGYFRERMRIPISAIREGQEGISIVRVTIDENGKLGNARVFGNLNGEFIPEALRLMKESPFWQPAMLNGKPVKVECEISIPFYFKKYIK